MEEKNLTDEQINLLTEFDEYGFAPTILMPNAEGYAKAWRNSLTDLFERLNFLQAEQKAEIERLTEKVETIENLRKIKHSLWEDEMRKNVELQKQVDELEQRYLEESKERCKFEQAYNKKCHEHNIGLGVQRKHWEKKVQQSVKDTAKDLLIEFDVWLYSQYDEKLDTYSIHIPVHEVKDFLTAKAKEYSVEVE